MQPGDCRFPCIRPGPVFSGLLVVALAQGTPVMGGEVTMVGTAPFVTPGQGLLDDGGAMVLERWSGWRNTTGIELILRAADGGLQPGGLFYQASEGVRVGAWGSLDLGSSQLSAIFTLKLDF